MHTRMHQPLDAHAHDHARTHMHTHTHAQNSAVFLTDSAEAIKEKITTHAFSGGRMTKAEQEELGADLEADVSYQWLTFFLDDDEELARIRDSYGSGKGEFWSTTLVKARLIQLLQEMVQKHQEARAVVTMEEVRSWMEVRELA